MKRLVAITTLLALGTGCIEMSIDLSVAKSGRAKMHTDFAIAEKAIAFLEGLGASLDQNFKEISEEVGAESTEPTAAPSDPMAGFSKAFGGGSDEQLARAKAHGLTLKLKQAKEGIAFSIDAKGKTIRSLDWYNVAMGLKDEPSETGTTLTKNNDGTVTLVMGGGMGDTPINDMFKDKPEGMPDMDEMGAMMAGMIAQMGAPFEVSSTITVPGRIVSATPDIALSVDGSTATWDFSIQDLMSFGQEPAPFTIVFEPKGKLSPTLFE